jgi:hypothetical protein
MPKRRPPGLRAEAKCDSDCGPTEPPRRPQRLPLKSPEGNNPLPPVRKPSHLTDLNVLNVLRPSTLVKGQHKIVTRRARGSLNSADDGHCYRWLRARHLLGLEHRGTAARPPFASAPGARKGHRDARRLDLNGAALRSRRPYGAPDGQVPPRAVTSQRRSSSPCKAASRASVSA